MLPTDALTASTKSLEARIPAPRTASFTFEATTRLPLPPPAFFAAFAMSVGALLEGVELEAPAAFQGTACARADRSRIAPRAGFRSETEENVAQRAVRPKKSISRFSTTNGLGGSGIGRPGLARVPKTGRYGAVFAWSGGPPGRACQRPLGNHSSDAVYRTFSDAT